MQDGNTTGADLPVPGWRGRSPARSRQALMSSILPALMSALMWTPCETAHAAAGFVPGSRGLTGPPVGRCCPAHAASHSLQPPSLLQSFSGLSGPMPDASTPACTIARLLRYPKTQACDSRPRRRSAKCDLLCRQSDRNLGKDQTLCQSGRSATARSASDRASAYRERRS